MRVVLAVVGQVVIEHDLEIIDIESARGDIGCDEKFETPAAKFLHHAGTLRLRDVAMQPVGRVAAGVQMFVELVDHDLRAAKNDAVTKIVQIDQPREHFDLRAALDLVIHLIDLRCVLRDRLDLDPLGIVRVDFDQPLDLVRHRGREKQRLTFLRRRAEDAVDVVTEAHVEHAVGFVEDGDAQFVQFQRAAFHVVHHATRRADHDLRTGGQRAKLPLVRLATVNRHGLKTAFEHRQLAHLFRHLHRQLAGRTKNQHLSRTKMRIGFFNGGQSKRRGFP